MTLRLGLFGASGRLGRAIVGLAVRDPEVSVVGAWTHASSKALGERVHGILLQLATPEIDVDGYIDVSIPIGLEERLGIALQNKRPFILGTTGLEPSDQALLEAAARHIPLLYAANFSLGMALLHKLARDAARLFYPHADIDLVETHHTQKKDAPSGSARLLARGIQQAHPEGKAPTIHSIRSGAVVGDHELRFNVAEEQLTLRHQAHSRDVFARGALLAARFLKGKAPGLYGMEQLFS